MQNNLGGGGMESKENGMRNRSIDGKKCKEFFIQREEKGIKNLSFSIDARVDVSRLKKRNDGDIFLNRSRSLTAGISQ